MCAALGIPFIYKSSYDKANRSSIKSFRGLGMDRGPQDPGARSGSRSACRCSPTCTRWTRSTPSRRWSTCCRRRRSCAARPISSAPSAATGKPVNIKKGQFLAPGDMKNVVEKAREQRASADNIMVCERGASFGYNNLVSDMRSLMIMRDTGCPVVFDATHSVQLPGRAGHLERRPARVRAGAGARGGGDAASPACSWKRTRSGEGALRRPQRLAAAAHEAAAGNAEGAGRAGQEPAASPRICCDRNRRDEQPDRPSTEEEQ